MRTRVIGCALLAMAALLAPGTAARAERTVIAEQAVEGKKAPGGIEGACGLALTPTRIYVSDYYHHAIDVFGAGGEYQSQIAADPFDGPCQLASAPSGALYANDWHESVSRVLPSSLSFDASESTGVAVDQATGNVYVDDRTHVAVYEPSGALREVVGEGTLQDGYGVAFAAGKLYVPDAATNEIEVYEPAVDPVNPAFAIDGHATPQKGLHSLTDAAVAVDPTNGHLLVIDNTQPGFEHPLGAIEEFTATGEFLGQLAKKVVDGGPSGIALTSSGELYVTSGNTEESKVLHFSPYTEGGGGPGQAQVQAPALGLQASAAASSSAASGSVPASTRPLPFAPLTQATVIRRGGIELRLDGKLTPSRLPRSGSAPVRVAVGAQISATADSRRPPQLRSITIAINRYGRFNSQGLPLCTERDIQPATTENALKACRGALVGAGSFEANVALGQQSPFPARGKMFAFNARIGGRPAILAHVYGVKPVPTSFTLPFIIRSAKGTFGTILEAKLPHTGGSEGNITGLSMNLGRSFTYKGRRRSYLSASCPAPKGFSGAPFALAKAGFGFEGGRRIGSTLVRNCRVGGN